MNYEEEALKAIKEIAKSTDRIAGGVFILVGFLFGTLPFGLVVMLALI